MGEAGSTPLPVISVKARRGPTAGQSRKQWDGAADRLTTPISDLSPAGVFRVRVVALLLRREQAGFPPNRWVPGSISGQRCFPIRTGVRGLRPALLGYVKTRMVRRGVPYLKGGER